MAHGVLLLTGAPGSGKTTTARLIATAATRGAHKALVARGHAVSYAILRPALGTCIARAAARPGDEPSNPDVITQLWNQFADTDGLERHVVEGDDLEPEMVAQTVADRWRATALRI